MLEQELTSVKLDNFDFFGPNFAKKGFRVGNSENQCLNKNQHHQEVMRANFQEKRTALTFSIQICPKMNFVVRISKI